jgi:DNA-binding transcriptional regulator LsrR (DeoR family)
MSKHNNGANKVKQFRKDKHFQYQFKIVCDAFFKQPQTMKELSVKTNIGRAAICRYCRKVRQLNQIAIVKKVYCNITKHLANQYTTNPGMFPILSKVKLF